MVRPTSAQLAVLTGFERVAFAACDAVNRTPLLKRAAHAYLRGFGAAWVHACSRNLVRVRGIERWRALRPDRGVLLLSNHRSFFDLYGVSCRLLRETSWVDAMYFPVRSTYFYERPDGLLVNALMSALAMYPPVLRDPGKRAMNQFSVEVLAEVLREPGTLVGIHPEGTRGKGPDPYSLLPAQPGAGQIAHAARPIVLPVFTLGLSNDFVRQVRGNFDGTGAPVTMLFGAPLDLDALYAEPARLRTYKRLADRMRDEIARLGAQERAWRESDGLPPARPGGA